MSDQDNAHLPNRRRPVHLASIEAHNRSPLVFVTVCTRERRPLLASPEAQTLLLEAWATAHHFQVGRFVIMPDHVHLFCAPAQWPPQALPPWVRVLEIVCGTPVAGPERRQALAARLLGYTTSVG